MSNLAPIVPPPDATDANVPAAGPLPDANLDAIEAALPTLETLGDLSAALRIAQAAEARLEAFFAPDSRVLHCLDPFGDAVQALWRIIAIRKSMVRLYKEIKSGVPSGAPHGAPHGVQPSGWLPPDPPSTQSTSNAPVESASIGVNPCSNSSLSSSAPSSSSIPSNYSSTPAPRTAPALHLPVIPIIAEIPTIPAANRRVLETIETFIKEIEVKYWRRLIRADRYGLPEPCDLPNPRPRKFPPLRRNPDFERDQPDNQPRNGLWWFKNFGVPLQKRARDYDDELPRRPPGDGFARPERTPAPT